MVRVRVAETAGALVRVRVDGWGDGEGELG